MLNADASRDSAYFYLTLFIRAPRLVHNQLAIFDSSPPLIYYMPLMLDNNM